MKSKRIDRLTGSLVREILQVTQRPEVISFAGGLPAEEIMPRPDFRHTWDEMRQYGPSEGEPCLRQLISQRLCALGRKCTAEQVLVTTGSQQGIDLVSKLFIDEGTAVALESPTYLAALQSFRLFGARLLGLSLAADGIAPESLRASLERQRPAFVYLIPSFQNPSGACYSAPKRQAIAAILDEYDVPLIEDDPYRELMYDPVMRTPISAFLKSAPWVYLGSFSKTLCPGLRVGYLAASPELFPVLARLKQASDLHTCRAAQGWIAEFIAGPEYEGHIERLRAHYRARRDAMDTALRYYFQDIAQWRLPAGGLFFWLALNRPFDTAHLLTMALARNVAFMPGAPFLVNEADPTATLRLNFSHSSPDKIERGIAILRDVIHAVDQNKGRVKGIGDN